MKAFTLATICVAASAQTDIFSSVVFPTDGKFRVRTTKDIDPNDEIARGDYRRAFERLNHFSGVDFFKSEARPTGHEDLGPKQAVVTPDISAHAYAEPNLECGNICHLEDKRIRDLQEQIAAFDTRYIQVRGEVVELGYRLG